ncbi:MAG: flavodoxin family protein [Candidatus Limnocylindrales bacterium]
MKSVIVYATTTGNTRAVATAVAEALQARGEAHLLSAEEARTALPADYDLLVVGGPTEAHGATAPMIAFLDRLGELSLDGRAAAAFDTRLWWPRVLSGSAAEVIAARLRAAGARLVVTPESFIVSMKPALEPGELERAPAWADTLAAAMMPVEPVAAG